jgi:hypothetical protein
MPGPARRIGGMCIVRRMPWMQVYLPDDLYAEVKARGLPASELLQEAVRAAVHREDLLAETETYLADLGRGSGATVRPPTGAR